MERDRGGGESRGERRRDVLAQSTTTNKTQQTTLCLFCELDQTNNVPILSCKHFLNQIHQIWRLLERRRNNSRHFTNLNYSKGVVYWKWNFIVYASRKLKSPTQVLASCAAENLYIRLYILPIAKPGQFCRQARFAVQVESCVHLSVHFRQRRHEHLPKASFRDANWEKSCGH